MKLSITGMPHRTDYRLELDGHNIARGLRRAVLDLDPSGVPTLELEIRVHELERLDVEEVQVLLPEATRDLLTRLGWTPPGVQDVSAERAAIVELIREYFAPVDDPLYEDVRILCERITRGEHRSRIRGQVEPDPPGGQVQPDPGPAAGA
ncbi:hypothetical protein ACFQ08_14485 [Streptosporangium algeriense]|uniref:Uncharacterized protein n=1 Tax=Streptosporangium algeriense TaxID=1682748 RepID=A0ABW3DSJ3_9ACTN